MYGLMNKKSEKFDFDFANTFLFVSPKKNKNIQVGKAGVEAVILVQSLNIFRFSQSLHRFSKTFFS